MEERPVYSYIPKNLNSTGGLLGGAVDTRRAVEAVAGLLIAVAVYKLLSPLIKSPVLVYVCAVLGIALAVAGLVGGNGEPLSVFLFNFINYENRRFFVTLRPPLPDFEAEAKKAGMKESRVEKKLAALLRKDSGAKGGESL